MISIKLCKNVDGQYVGLTYSDRWNLDTLRREFNTDPNTAGFRPFQNEARDLGFTLSVTKIGTSPLWTKTVAEFAATLSRPLRAHIESRRTRVA